MSCGRLLIAPLLAGIALAAAQPAQAAPRCERIERIVPGPASAPNGDAVVFAGKLHDVVKARDLDGFTALLSPEVTVSFGGDGGRAEFREQWELSTPGGQARLWQTLDRLLGLGPHAETGELPRLTWPWFFATWPEEPEAWGMHVVLPGTALRAGPSPYAKVLATLPQQVVETVGENRSGWQQVKLAGRCPGYIHQSRLWPVIGYRLIAERGDKGWEITAFVAGD